MTKAKKTEKHSYSQLIETVKLGKSKLLDLMVERKGERKWDSVLTDFIEWSVSEGITSKHEDYGHMTNVRKAFIRLSDKSGCSNNVLKQVGIARLLRLPAPVKIDKKEKTGYVKNPVWHDWTDKELQERFFPVEGHKVETPEQIKNAQEKEKNDRKKEREQKEAMKVQETREAIENKTNEILYQIFPDSLLRAGISEKRTVQALQNFSSELPAFRKYIQDTGGYTACVKQAVKNAVDDAPKLQAVAGGRK